MLRCRHSRDALHLIERPRPRKGAAGASMYLTRLQLEQFRNYARLDLAVPRHGLLLFGANASGKTSFLEALYLLATTRSPRAGVERELIRWGSGEDYGVP